MNRKNLARELNRARRKLKELHRQLDNPLISVDERRSLAARLGWTRKKCRNLLDRLRDENLSPAISVQPPPESGRGDIWALVIADMRDRRELGIRKYGAPLQAGNGRDSLIDAYQEALDLAVYLRQAIAERN